MLWPMASTSEPPAAQPGTLLADQRRALIADEVRRRGAVRVSELTERLAVSDMTIRRDLDLLASAGVLEKVHGGATALGLRSTDEPGFEAKSHRQLDEKEAIAQRAVSLVSPGQAIALTAGAPNSRGPRPPAPPPPPPRPRDTPPPRSP